MSGEKQGHRKERVGVVVKSALAKTALVQIEKATRHPLYRKVRRTARKLKVHDEAGTAKVGDKVRIVETRPLSKEKRWRLKEVIGHTP